MGREGGGGGGGKRKGGEGVRECNNPGERVRNDAVTHEKVTPLRTL